MTHAKDPAALEKQLDDLISQEAVLGEKGVQLKSIGILDDSLKISSPRSFEYLLHTKKVTSAFVYYWYTKQWRSKAAALLAASAVLVLLLLGARFLQSPSTMGRYYAWRLKKENATDLNRDRARRNLLVYSRLDPGPAID